MMRTVAALDAGTNTIRLLIVTRTAQGELVERTRQLRYVGLGHGVDATGRFDQAAIERGWAAVDDYAEQLRSHDCQLARFVATSASRDADNREEFFAGVRQRLGINPELISGEEEARLSFAGALSGARLTGDPVLVMDSGGGSTELVRGDMTGQVGVAQSIDIGSRRVRERYLHDDPPTPAQIAAARAEVNRLLDASPVSIDDVATFIGVAGTVTSMAAVHLGLAAYDSQVVHGAQLTVGETVDLAERLLAMSVAEVAALGPVAPERAKVLSAGALVVAEVARRVRVNLQASESDILDGVVMSILQSNAGQSLPR
ncbi:MAG: exopolyphosphatase [Brooklawnia sp.]|jgi:exopolyphosphatase/guanosine-5'-triphosphate,3'-diphosphate pyrophosphatase